MMHVYDVLLIKYITHSTIQPELVRVVEIWTLM